MVRNTDEQIETLKLRQPLTVVWWLAPGQSSISCMWILLGVIRMGTGWTMAVSWRTDVWGQEVRNTDL
ncbi:hypothetical protein EYF80_029118 [Liparis tanakae]|uniref:Uncharacterized protein n=1 Tax=Liparis tanakae TaxID=230148 RepID=A0A4Z2H5X8_9TELE|nr:hypothetical protein EYF80_029118 [Liparis tanakae]